MKKLLILLSILTAFANLFAALTITTDVTSTEEGKSTEKIFLDNNNLRVDMKDVSILFDTKKQIMTTIMHDKKIYVQMTKAEMEQQTKMMKTMMAQQIKAMEAQKANMSPEQQKAMDKQLKLMKDSMNDKNDPTEDIRATKKSETVGKWKCKIFNSYTDGKKDSEMCTVPFKKLNISAKDFKIIDEIAKIVGDNESALKVMKAMKKTGYPVKESSFNPFSGKIESVRTLKSISRDKIDSKVFKAPAKYKKTTMKELMGM